MFVKEFPNGLPEHLRGKVLGDKAFTPFADIITPPTLETLKRFVGSEELHRCLFKLMSASELVSWVRSRIEGMFGVSSLLKYGVKLVVVGRARRSTFGRRVDRDAALERHELAALQGMCALTVFIEECSFQLKVGCGSRYTTPLWLAQEFHAHRHITTLQFYGEELLKTAAAAIDGGLATPAAAPGDADDSHSEDDEQLPAPAAPRGPRMRTGRLCDLWAARLGLLAAPPRRDRVAERGRAGANAARHPPRQQQVVVAPTATPNAPPVGAPAQRLRGIAAIASDVRAAGRPAAAASARPAPPPPPAPAPLPAALPKAPAKKKRGRDWAALHAQANNANRRAHRTEDNLFGRR